MRLDVIGKLVAAIALLALPIDAANEDTQERAAELVRDKVSNYYGSLTHTAILTNEDFHTATVVLEQMLGGTMTNRELRSVIQNIYSGLLKLDRASVRKVEVFVWKQDGNNPDVWHPVWHVVASGKNAEWDKERENFAPVFDIISKEMRGTSG